MLFVCQIGNCKRNKTPSVFLTWEDLHAHINGTKWDHGRDGLKYARLDKWNKTRFQLNAEDRASKASQRTPVPGNRS